MKLIKMKLEAIVVLLILQVFGIGCYLDIQCDTVMPESTGRSVHIIREGIDPKFPYYIEKDTYTPGQEKTLEEVIEYLETYSCVRMPRVGSSYPGKKLRVIMNNPSCVTVWAGSKISIGIGGCDWHRPSIAHEIAHVYGHGHEQGRLDANESMKITANDGRYFIDVKGIPYDLFSIMQYTPSLKYNGLNWLARDRRITFMVGRMSKNNPVQNNSYMTYNDLRRFNYQLKCNATCGNINTTWCENQGYLAPAKTPGETCKCNCPYGTSGDRCENGSPLFYSDFCGGNFDNDTEIITPGYGKPKSAIAYVDRFCTYIIQAKPGKRIQVEWNDFNIGYMNSRGGCSNGYVEIRTTDKWKGTYYCTQLIPKNGKMIASEGQDLAIMIEPQWSKYGRGLKGFAKYIDIQTPIGCGHNSIIEISDNSDPVIITRSKGAGAACKWHFKTNWPKTKIGIRFTKIHINLTSEGNNEILVFPKPESDINFYYKSYNDEMKNLYSYGNELIVETNLQEDSYFSAEIFGLKTTPQLFAKGFSRCNESEVHVSKSSPGSFMSPNYYGLPYRGDATQYPPNIHCVWTYKTTDSSVKAMKIDFEQTSNWFKHKFTTFEIDCNSDELYIEGSDGIRKKICSKGVYSVSGKEMKIIFTSDESSQKVGFIGNVHAVSSIDVV